MRLKNKVGKEVLDIYQKENPSAINIENKSQFNKFYSGQKRLWQERLKMPLRALNNALILDYGCGTGEIDIFLGLQGARIEGVDFNKQSIERARRLSKHFGLGKNLNFKVADIHNCIYPKRTADLAICLGVLPHVYGPAKVFMRILQSCKNEAFIVIGFIEELGIIQRLLHRSIVRAIARFDEDKIIKIAKQAFPEHINRSIKFGQRTERSVIFDYLVNRHMYGLSLEEVLGWFDKNNVSYYSSWPSIELPFEINPYTSKRLSLAHPLLKEYRSLLRLRWLFSQHEDGVVIRKLTKSLKIPSISNYIDDFSQILTSLVQNQRGAWEKDDLNRTNYINKKIFKNINGLFNRFQEFINKELESKINSLNKVLFNILTLQSKEAEDFKPVHNLFKELNGLGTFYLVGVVNKK